MKNRMRVLLDFLRKAQNLALKAIVAVITALLIAQALSRYLLMLPIYWSEELTRYLMIWGAFIGSAVAVRLEGHVAASFLAAKGGRNLQRFLKSLTRTVLVLFLAVLIYYGFALSLRVSGQLSPALQISMMWPYLSIPVGCCLMLIEIVAAMLLDNSNLGWSGPSQEA